MLRLTGAEPADRLARGRIPRTRMSRWALAALVLSLIVAPVEALADERDAWAALVSGSHIALVRHGNAPPG